MYRVTWLGADRKTLGSAPEFTIDDPQHPPKPSYPNAPTAEDIAAAAAPAEKAPSNGAGDLGQLAALLGAGGGAGMQTVAMMQFLFGTQREIRREEATFAEQRLAREMRVHEQNQARDREWYRTQLENQKTVYDALIKLARPTRDEDEDEDEDDLREELDEIKLRLEKGGSDGSGTDFLARQGGELLQMLKQNPQYIGEALKWVKDKVGG